MTIETTTNTATQAIVNTDKSKVFLGDNETTTLTYTNTSGAEKTISRGLVFGQISATSLALPLESDASDGSQYPYGILMNETLTLAIGASATVTLVTTGGVDEDKLIFENGTDTLATAISGKTLRARIGSDTVGVRLIKTIENTRTDNQ